MRRAAVVVLALTALLVPGAAMSRTIAKTDIFGKWCGGVANYLIAEEALVVELKDRTTKTFPIKAFTIVDDTWVNVAWIRDHEVKGTNFKIDPDGQLVQAANTSGDRGPERHFRRC